MSNTRNGRTIHDEPIDVTDGAIKERRKKRKKTDIENSNSTNTQSSATESAREPRKKKRRIHADGSTFDDIEQFSTEDLAKEKTKKKRRIVEESMLDDESEYAIIESQDVKPHPAATAAFVQNMPERTYASEDFDFLSINEHLRYNNNSAKIGHAVITKNNQGEEVALQYSIPEGTDSNTPKVRPLINIESIQRFGLRRFRASTPDNHTPMYATRYIDLELTENNAAKEMKIACFSPTNGQEPFWGGKDEDKPLFRKNLKKSVQKELDKEASEIGVRTKGGTELVVDHESVKIRDTIKKRTPDQNTVMGESAKDAYEAFYDEMTDELSSDMKEIFKRAIEAPLKHAFKSNYRPEWLHAEGFSLTPMSKNPQLKENLGSAPKWANTEMMVLERIAKWFALNRPHAFIKIKPHFEMLLNSELIKKIKFEVSIEEKNRFVRLLQTIDPFKKYHIFRKATDVAQGTKIVHDLLEGTPPISQQKVKSGSGTISVPTHAAATHAPTTHAAITTSSASHTNIVSSAPANIKNQYPTHIQYEKNVVQILTTTQHPNYDTPWSGTEVGGCSGTGLVISHDGKKYVMTNAHCVENSVVIRVRLANNRTKKFEATRKCVSYQCDLALLEIADPEFANLADAVDFGEMISLKQKVFTVGFPMGGSEISISKGIVSRVEVRDYCMSGLNMLQVQIDAAVNSGNSGGPVFSDNKVVGITFQGYGLQGLGYMIPIPIIRHFLTEAFSNKKYRGFPILPTVNQPLENAALRAYYGLTKDQSGVRVSSIDNLCDAYNKLKPDDILLEIDGLTISNEGTVDIPGVGNCIDFVHVTQMKYIGDSVTLKVLRKNPDTKESKIELITVMLDRVPLETEKVPQTEYDKMPTYYVASGISFMPVTRNYLEGKGSELDDCFVIEAGCTLANMPKKSEDEQIIVVNDVLDSEATQGYEEYVNSVVTEINGKRINNILDVVTAIESNLEPTHCIVTSSKKKIVVINMSKDAHDKLLKKYNIHSDRSDDLLADSNSMKLSNSLTAISALTSPSKSSSAMQKSQPSKKSTFQSLSDEMTDEEEEQKVEKRELTINDMPGYKKYTEKLSAMETFYKSHQVASDEDLDDEEDEDYEADQDDSPSPVESETEEDLSNDEEEIASIKAREKEKVKPNFSLTKLSDRNRLFKSKQHKPEDDEERPSFHKKQKFR